MTRLHVTGLVAILFGASLMGSPRAEAMGGSRPSYLMASLGDSMTAASLADTTTQTNWVNIPNPDNPNDPESFLGGKNYTNKSSFSWASGVAIDSHYTKLRRYLASQPGNPGLTIKNVAIPGSISLDLPAQADQIVAAANSGKFLGVKYVTILIGANDSTAGTDDNNMHEALLTTMDKIASIRQDEPIRVLISSFPKVPDLGFPEIQNHSTAGYTTCKGIRSTFFTYGRSMTDWSTEAEYLQKMQVVNDKIHVLKTVAEESQARYPNLSVAFSMALYNYQIKADDLAIDCFHPNRFGQATMSEYLWNDQPWFK